MARIRTIKPEFFTSEDIVALSPLARLLYIATWCEADKEGRLPWKPRTMKLRYFPADTCDIDALARELVASGLVVPYGDGLAFIPNFTRHQHVNPRESKSVLPEPPGWQPILATGPARGDIRAIVLERDGHKCVRCGSVDRLEIDHILPQSAGGPTIEENLRTMCKPCNAGRPVSGAALQRDLALDGYSLDELRAKYLRVATRGDASILDLHAQGGREGKGKERDTRVTRAPSRKTALPEGFAISESVKAWAAKEGYRDLDRHLAYFTGYAKANGKTYTDWDHAFMNAVRGNWAKLPTNGGSPTCPRPEVTL